MSDLLDKAAVAEASFSSAASISAQQTSAQAAAQETPVAPATTELSFEQTIIAPKTPSPVEVYRNTNNLINLAKEALTNATK